MLPITVRISQHASPTRHRVTVTIVGGRPGEQVKISLLGPNGVFMSTGNRSITRPGIQVTGDPQVGINVSSEAGVPKVRIESPDQRFDSVVISVCSTSQATEEGVLDSFADESTERIPILNPLPPAAKDPPIWSPRDFGLARPAILIAAVCMMLLSQSGSSSEALPQVGECDTTTAATCTKFTLLHRGPGPEPEGCFIVGCKEGHAETRTWDNSQGGWIPCAAYDQPQQIGLSYVVLNKHGNPHASQFENGEWIPAYSLTH